MYLHVYTVCGYKMKLSRGDIGFPELGITGMSCQIQLQGTDCFSRNNALNTQLLVSFFFFLDFSFN